MHVQGKIHLSVPLSKRTSQTHRVVAWFSLPSFDHKISGAEFLLCESHISCRQEQSCRSHCEQVGSRSWNTAFQNWSRRRNGALAEPSHRQSGGYWQGAVAQLKQERLAAFSGDAWGILLVDFLKGWKTIMECFEKVIQNEGRKQWGKFLQTQSFATAFLLNLMRILMENH